MDDTPRPVLEHLEELRKRLFWVVGTIAVIAVSVSFWSREAFEILMAPAVTVVRARGRTLIAVAPSELFLVYLKTSVLAGFLLATPVTLWQFWSFVAPGLYENERKFAAPFVLATTLLFFTGCAFGYFVAFPTMFEFFASLESDSVQALWTTQEVFSFVAWLYVAFGFAFELPVLLVFLALAGIVTPQWLAAQRKWAILLAFVVGAALTPSPDVMSQLLLSVPLCLLYEISIWAAFLLVRKPAAAPTSALPRRSR